MSLHIVGLNHKTASLEMREKLAFKEENRVSDLRNLTDGEIIRESLILSTCNRVEILLEGESSSALTRTIEFLAASKSLSQTLFADHLYHYSDEQAVRHLFRVASSLDSMVVGEAQILGQVRTAYRLATEAGTARRKIHKLLHHAFRAAKRVRSEARIGNPAASVSSAAVEKSREIFGSLINKTVLLIGAGEMAELAAKQLAGKGANRILICNRTLGKALELAEKIGGEVLEFEKLDTVLPSADVIICSTAAPDYVISAENVRRSQSVRKHRPTLFIDISVPRNVAPDITDIENVFLSDVDDLQTVIAANTEIQNREISFAEKIVDEEVGSFWTYLTVLETGEMLGLLQQKMSAAAQREFRRYRPRLGELTPEQEDEIEQLVRSTVNKIAHPVLYSLRRAHETGAAEFAEILCTMLGGNETESNPERR